MVFIGFMLITGVLLIYAYFAGNIGYFINLDSILLVILPGLIFSIFNFKLKEYFKGIKSMFIFSLKNINKDNKVASHYRSLIFVTIIFGILSTAQGLFSYILADRDYKKGLIKLSEFAMDITIGQAIVYASFSTVYALLISFFLLYPIHIMYKENLNVNNILQKINQKTVAYSRNVMRNVSQNLLKNICKKDLK
jgi:flagellar motor component MotA